MLRGPEAKREATAAVDAEDVVAALLGDPVLVEAALAPALRRAELDGDDQPRFRFHDCRHSFASLLIAEGLDVVFVSRQLGHANPSITLSVYAHLFDRMRHAERTREALEASFGTILEPNGGDGAQPTANAATAEVAYLRR